MTEHASVRGDEAGLRRWAHYAIGISVAPSRTVASARRLPSKGRDPPPERGAGRNHLISQSAANVDASKPFRRTPAGDAEVKARTKGLSVTQRRILTLLDSPGRLRDLPLGPMMNTARLTRDAARLTQAGLVSYEASDPALVAANAASLALRNRSPLTRTLPLVLIASAVCALIWIGWRFSAAPSASSDTRTGAGAASAATAAPGASVEIQEPPVIATRVLRGDGDRARESSKDARISATKTSGLPSADAAHASTVESAVASQPPATNRAAEPTTASGPELEPDSRSENAGSTALPEH